MIAYNKEEKHELVRHGVYSISRHPSYFGFFIWGIGSQLMLVNILSTPMYAYVLWHFFNDRIRYEERLLIKFFGAEYINYRRTVSVLIPYVEGYSNYDNSANYTDDD